MVKILLLSLLFYPAAGGSQSHLIEWKADRKLSWADFQGAPVSGTDNAALTSSNINFNFGYGSNGFRYSISCRFDKSRSWVRVKNDHILAHEQAHFDIAELHARKLKKALSSYKYREATVNNDLNRIYDTVMKEHHQMQTQYDQETDHSRKFDKQAEWLTKVAGELKAHDAYANYK
jgi:hypothetical protein